MKKILLILAIGMIMLITGCSRNDSFSPYKKVLEEEGYSFEVIKAKDIQFKFIDIENSELPIEKIYKGTSSSDGLIYFLVCKNNDEAQKLYEYCWSKTIATNYRTSIKNNIVYISFCGPEVLKDFE